MFLGPDPIGRRWTGAGLGPRLCPGAFPALLVARRRVTVAPRKRGVAWRASGSARARALRSRTCRVEYTRQTRNVSGAWHGRP